MKIYYQIIGRDSHTSELYQLCYTSDFLKAIKEYIKNGWDRENLLVRTLIKREDIKK